MTFKDGPLPGYLCALPPGFRQLTCKGDMPPTHFTQKNNGKVPHTPGYSPISLVFVNTPELPSPHRSTHDNRLNIHCFPQSLTLLTLNSHAQAAPLAYLNEMESQLEKTLPRYHRDFTGAETWDTTPRFVSQSHFKTNFTIYRLSCCWTDQNTFFVTALTTAEGQCKKGWQLLKNFVHSFKLL